MAKRQRTVVPGHLGSHRREGPRGRDPLDVCGRPAVTVVCWALLCALVTHAHPVPALAQELPASAASDLVEQALADRLDVSPPRRSVRSRLATPRRISALAGVVALAVLIHLRVRQRRPAQRAEECGSEVTTGVRGWRESVAQAPSPAPEILALPPHVLQILQRSAERRHSEAETTQEYGREHEATAEGIDIVVPRYDPRRGG